LRFETAANNQIGTNFWGKGGAEGEERRESFSLLHPFPAPDLFLKKMLFLKKLMTTYMYVLYVCKHVCI
jgi:hypothetical protein